ncbi:unnamed protein product [Lota lota]
MAAHGHLNVGGDRMREQLIHGLEEERRMRDDSEDRLANASHEPELGRAQMVTLQPLFSRMDGAVRSLLQTPGVPEPAAVDPRHIMRAYKKRQDRPEHHSSPAANQTEPGAGHPSITDTEACQSEEDQIQLLLEQLKSLEEKNCTLTLENRSQRETYERCLDEVANQVVQAVLTQKDLREECMKLRSRVLDLEQQNRALSVLFQQQLRPTSDLLLQKLHSRIMGLSATDLLSEPDVARGPGPRNLHEVQLNGKAGLPVSRCLSQLSLVVPMGAFQHSSCSSSELSLSSACSDFSSGSFTWNECRPFGQMSPLTQETRRTLGSSAPGDICGVPEEPAATQCKESHILEGLRKLQRRKHRSAPSSSKISRAGVGKDCMNSNEGIYSLGIKSGSKGVLKPPYLGRASALGAGSKKVSYESDDADDESIHRVRGDNVPGKDNWFYCRKLSRSVSDGLCSWEGRGDGGGGPAGTKRPRECDFKERPEKLTSFITSFLPGRGRTSAFTRVSLLEPDGQLRLSDPEDPEEVVSEASDVPACLSCSSERVESDPGRDAARLPERQCLRREQRRTQSAEGRPRPFSLLMELKGPQVPQSEERPLAVFDADGGRLSVRAGPQHYVPVSEAMTDCPGPSNQERPTRQKAGNGRKHTVHQSPEKPWACQSKATNTCSSRGGGAERLGVHMAQQRKLMKPPGNRADKGQSVPSAADPSPLKSCGSRPPGQCKSGSPLRLSKGCSTEPSNGVTSGPPGEDRSPLSPPVKLSRFIKTSGGSAGQSPKVPASSPPATAPTPSSPHLTRRPLDCGDWGEEPTRDRHCEPSNKHLRSPSPPPPPGRTASLLVKPNYEGSAQASTPTTVRGPPPSYHPPPVPNTQPSLPPKGRDSLELDAGYGTAPQKPVDKTGQHLQRSPAAPQTPTKGTSRRTTVMNYLPSANSGCTPEHTAAPQSSTNVPPPYGALRGCSFQGTFVTKRGALLDHAPLPILRTCSAVPVTPPDRPHPTAEPQDSGTVRLSVGISPSQTEKASKTRIPVGFKAFLKPPTSHKNGPSVPGKHEKDHINAVSKETLISNPPLACASMPSAGNADASADPLVVPEARVRGAERRRTALPEDAGICDGGRRGSHLFLRSVSASTKPHWKPALGMNGAKARSQSFSTSCAEKPSGNALDAPGKVRTHIITNSGERGASLSRQGSLEAPAGPGPLSPLRSPGTRVSYYGGRTEVTAPSVVPPRGSGPASRGSPEAPPVERELRSVPVTERKGLRNVRKASKVASHPQCYASSFGAPASSGSQTLLISAATPGGPRKPDPSRGLKTQPEPPDQQASRTSCTMEEKVMMGIEENLQKCQEQEKVSASEAKQKTGPSLANWFGLRKSKLPALGGKKAETPKAKEEKKEVKTSSVLGVRQARSDKRKEKRRSDCRESVEGQDASPTSSKLGSVLDQCNIHMMASQIQCTAKPWKPIIICHIPCRGMPTIDLEYESDRGGTIFENESRTGSHRADNNKALDTWGGVGGGGGGGGSQTSHQVHDHSASFMFLICSKKYEKRWRGGGGGGGGEGGGEEEKKRRCREEEERRRKGSSCQMRTLDSGIGTYPLPGTVGRRPLPKSQSSPGRVVGRAGSSCSPPPPPPPPRQLLGNADRVPPPPQERPSAAPSSDCSGSKRLILKGSCEAISTANEEEEEEEEERDGGMKSQRLLSNERTLRAFTGRSTEREAEEHSPGLKTLSLDTPLSIMDCYRDDAFPRLEMELRRFSHYGQSGDSLTLSPGRPPVAVSSLDSLNQLIHAAAEPGSRALGGGLGLP